MRSRPNGLDTALCISVLLSLVAAPTAYYVMLSLRRRRAPAKILPATRSIEPNLGLTFCFLQAQCVA
jgi:hypothetical protein